MARGKRANNADALDGGTALEFDISHPWPAASDVIRYALPRCHFLKSETP